MTPKIALITMAGILLFSATLAMAAEPKAKNTPPSVAPGPAATTVTPGRFVALTPPASGGQNGTYMMNFLWVVDTATGSVAVHRVASTKNDKGDYDGVILERVTDERTLEIMNAVRALRKNNP